MLTILVLFYTTNLAFSKLKNSSQTRINCYDSCSECKIEDDSINHNCLKCASNYSHLSDNISQCYKNLDIVNGYYYDNSTLSFEKCNPACNRCSKIDSIVTCKDCNKGYILSRGSCIPIKHISLAFDANVCYPLCMTCEEKGNEDDHKCTSCIEGFSLIYPDGKSMCIGNKFNSSYFFKLSFWVLLYLLIICA
jgi:hypothetical protein